MLLLSNLILKHFKQVPIAQARCKRWVHEGTGDVCRWNVHCVIQLHGSQQPGEIIRCIDKNDYSTLSFPVGTRVTFSIDDTTTEEESGELTRVESRLGKQDDFFSSDDSKSLFSDEEDSLSSICNEEESRSNDEETRTDAMIPARSSKTIAHGNAKVTQDQNKL